MSKTQGHFTSRLTFGTITLLVAWTVALLMVLPVGLVRMAAFAADEIPVMFSGDAPWVAMSPWYMGQHGTSLYYARLSSR